MSKERVVSVRLEESMIGVLQALALVDKTTLATEIRDALTDYIDRRKGEPALRRKVEEARRRQDELLETLGG